MESHAQSRYTVLKLTYLTLLVRQFTKRILLPVIFLKMCVSLFLKHEFVSSSVAMRFSFSIWTLMHRNARDPLQKGIELIRCASTNNHVLRSLATLLHQMNWSVTVIRYRPESLSVPFPGWMVSFPEQTVLFHSQFVLFSSNTVRSR